VRHDEEQAEPGLGEVDVPGDAVGDDLLGGLRALGGARDPPDLDAEGRRAEVERGDLGAQLLEGRREGELAPAAGAEARLRPAER